MTKSVGGGGRSLRDRGIVEPVERRVLEMVVPVSERGPLAAIYIFLELRHERVRVRYADAHGLARGCQERFLGRLE